MESEEFRWRATPNDDGDGVADDYEDGVALFSIIFWVGNSSNAALV